jgi:hypothetical protein
VHRQALAGGMLWTKQYYYFDLDKWLDEHEAHPLLGTAHRNVRNAEWFHMLNSDIISMPDKWEYAAWDLAFHTIALSLVDFDFAKDQLLLFGGNSNWGGPVWMPMNGLLIRGLLNLYQFYGDDFKVQCPTGSGKYMTLFEVAKELAQRLSNIFLRDANGRPPAYGGTRKFQEDPHWKDCIPFYEYSIDLFARLQSAAALQISKDDLAARMTRGQVAGG